MSAPVRRGAEADARGSGVMSDLFLFNPQAMSTLRGKRHAYCDRRGYVDSAHAASTNDSFHVDRAGWPCMRYGFLHRSSALLYACSLSPRCSVTRVLFCKLIYLSKQTIMPVHMYIRPTRTTCTYAQMSALCWLCWLCGECVLGLDLCVCDNRNGWLVAWGLLGGMLSRFSTVWLLLSLFCNPLRALARRLQL